MRPRLSRGLAAARLALRGGARYAGNAPRLFATRLFDAAGEHRQQLREDLALRTAEDVAATLGTMKGVLMKLGQMASYIDDGLTPAARRTLARLQDSVPPMSPALAACVVRAELGSDPEEVFATWDPSPIAAASIGQVHRAMTRDGRAVAVKVQYPGIAETIEADLGNVALLRKMLRIMAPSQDVNGLLAELRERITEELDYRLEARNQQLFASYYAGHPTIHVPAVLPGYSGRRVVTSELADGARFSALASWPQPERDLAAETIYRFVFRGLYEMQAFNGDPHPGNYLFGGGGKVTFLDFGLVKHFTDDELAPLVSMVKYLCVERDPAGFRSAMEEAGFLLPGAPVSTDAVIEHMALFYDTVRTPGRRTMTGAYASSVSRRFFDFRSPLAPYARIPRSYVILQRINLGLFALLGDLSATADWRRIAEEIWPFTQGPPSTPMGEAEIPWRAAVSARAAGLASRYVRCGCGLGRESGMAGAGLMLLLRAVDVGGPLRWRWLLTDAETGAALADHQVDLDPGSADLAAFGDLYGYVRSYAAPDRRAADEARIVEQTARWAGRAVLGERVGTAIAAAAPVTVRVTVPAEAGAVLLWPLELACVDGGPLAGRGDVSFVYDIVPDGARRAKSDEPDVLRVLAVFSLPTGTGVVALRRARHELSRLIRRTAAREGAAVELRVVQYGVTRERLARIADSRDGWDVLQLWGHGGPGVFVLEHADGSPDRVDTTELVELLRPLRQRVKLAVVSACESAAATTAETLRLIGLGDRAVYLEREQDEAATARGAMGVARALVTELDCAVVGMRYPVTDEFAIAFGNEFYERLLEREQPVDVAVARAVAKAGAAASPVELATPGMFGARAAGLRLAVPQGIPRMDPAEEKMAYFPDEPERFVGRVAAMAAASAVLAPDSGRTAVLLHGMAGAGKTACALELAYRHQDSFAATAFWQAPAGEEDEFGAALGSLAARLDIQLRDYGFTMAGNIGNQAAFEAFLPRLRQVMRTKGLLLVLDNLESLLTADGSWRDPRWGPLIAALTSHGGESRLIMTSRIPPAGTGPSALVLPVHALSLEEAATLARELTHLRALLHIDPDPETAPAEAEVGRDRDRVRRVLRVVQGHPKLLELADAAAADPARLDAQLAAAERAGAGEELDAFFRDGTSTLDPDQFLTVLSGWTTRALAVLPAAARLLAEFVACLEDEDRQPGVIEATWGDVWRRLGRPGDPPGPGPLLGALAAAALVQPESFPAGPGQPADGVAAGPAVYRMHPGVAAAIQGAAAPEVRAAADTELGAFWESVSGRARQREGGEDTAMVVRAGLAAAPYLLRRGQWDTAATLLEDAVHRDGSPGVVQAVLPPLRRIAAATQAPGHYGVLASALRTVDPAEAERLLRDTLRAAAGTGDYRVASATAGELVTLLYEAGRLDQALEVAGQTAGYTGQAGLGPWTALLDQGQRLQILALAGEHEQVLAGTAVLRARMGELPDRPAANETVRPWNVREVILDTGYISALALGRWQQCLDLTAEITASTRQRGAGLHELTRTRVNDAWPLIRLGRVGEAGRLLRECQQVFQDHADTPMLARVLGARAGLEDELGHPDTAAEFGRTALRLGYARPDPRDIATGHHNLANYLREAGGDPAGQRAHRLAAALIRRLAGMTHDLARTRRALAAELRQDGTAGAGRLPGTLAAVVRVAERTDGVRLGELITALQPDREAAEAALAQLLREAADLPPEDGIAAHLQEWEPVIADVAAACRGDRDAAARLGPVLDECAGERDWAALTAVLRRILGGERGEDLLDGLDAVDTAIAREILTRLADGEREPPRQ